MDLLERLISRSWLALRGARQLPRIAAVTRLSRMPSLARTLAASHGDAAVLDDTRAILESMPPERFDAIFTRYQHVSPAPGYSKYLDLSSHLCRAVRGARQLELHAASPLAVLDIGAGAGFFARASRQYGHRVLGLDLGDVEMYAEMRALFEVPWLQHRVTAFQPLPDLGDKMDLVTGFQIMFDRRADGSPWGAEEWRFFIEDVAGRLNRGGRLFLGLNTFQGSEAGAFALATATLRQLGACIEGHDVLFANLA